MPPDQYADRQRGLKPVVKNLIGPHLAAEAASLPRSRPWGTRPRVPALRAPAIARSISSTSPNHP